MLDILGLGVDIGDGAAKVKLSTTKEIDMKNADMPVMPIVDADATPMSHQELSDWRENSCLGLTKREMMAMHMMQGLISANATYGGRTDARDTMAKDAVTHADALLAELEKQQ